METTLDIQSLVLQSTLTEVHNISAATQSTPDPCVVCLEEISEKAEACPCGHANFDFICLANWLETASSCPLCKSLVQEVRYRWSSETNFQTYTVNRISTPQNAQSQRFNPSRRLPRPRPRAPRTYQDVSLTNDALQRRREVYLKQLYSLHVGSNRVSKYKELTPTMFSQDPELISKAKMWIRRELRVFEFLRNPISNGITRPTNSEFLLQFIVAILKNIDLKGSEGQAEEMIQEFLGRTNTKIFLHELRTWLRSPYDTLESWDRHNQYAEVNLVPSDDRL